MKDEIKSVIRRDRISVVGDEVDKASDLDIPANVELLIVWGLETKHYRQEKPVPLDGFKLVPVLNVERVKENPGFSLNDIGTDEPVINVMPADLTWDVELDVYGDSGVVFVIEHCVINLNTKRALVYISNNHDD
jgi:hypothetical protein